MYKLYNLLTETQLETVELEELPLTINWLALPQALHQNTVVVKGERKETLFYSDYDGIAYDETKLVIKVTYNYIRDENGNAVKRERLRGFTDLNGTVVFEPTPDVKFYNDQQQIEEGIRRRRNMTTWLRGAGRGGELEPAINAFVKEVELQLVSFIDTHDTTILDTVANSTLPWMDLDVTGYPGYKIRQYILDNMTY